MITRVPPTTARELLIEVVMAREMPVHSSSPSMITPVPPTTARELLSVAMATGRDQPSSFRTTTPGLHPSITTASTAVVGRTSTINNIMLGHVQLIMTWVGGSNMASDSKI